jgi:putative hydrolase of the HAD superfamily
MIRAVCFDLFHTLVDVGKAPATPGRYTADILGLDREDWNNACFSDAHEICAPTDHREVVRALAHSLDDSIPLELIQLAADERKARFDYTLQNIDTEVLSVLAQLKQRGLKLALVSNASTGEVDSWSSSPLASLFDEAVFSCDCGYAKPDAAIYQQALRQLQVESGHCLYVGDGGSNELQGAARCGLRPVMLSQHVAQRLTAAQYRARRQHAEAEISQLAELLSLLETL